MHPYHTRIRNPPQNALPDFPPPHVVLHPEDAANKVFLAVARAFVSVDNRAMTIKDIAERATAHGLVCQNLSAAAQAVTTYLRAHKARCDKQQDQPLLLSHTLAGTPADDDLLPALFSRSGGDSAQPPPGRSTNFRKGTAVWYLSRATGVPCPFTRAGIRLCDYVVRDEAEQPRRRSTTPACGEKRKRPLRGCAKAEEEEAPPPKVKLTLRLKPLMARLTPPEGATAARPIDVSDEDDADDSMSVSSEEEDEEDEEPQPHEEEWALPPYPRRSISIPCYTPTAEVAPPTAYMDRRSPSAFATPPPDSDDEAEDFHVAMAQIKDYAEEEEDNDGWDADLDSEGEEGETVWESPGPRSPSAPLVQPADIAVKEEPRDVQGMLDAWEDFDTSVAVAEVLSKAFETDARPQVKLEPVDPWDLDASRWPAEDLSHIKQEDFGVDSLFPQGPSTPLSPLASLASQFAAFSYADGSEPDDDITRAYARPRAHTVPAPMAAAPPPPVSAPPLTRASISASSVFARTACVSPLETRCQPSFALGRAVVVTTCQPCKPAISATQIEDISVYQMMLGAFQLLRRIDTDFVNLSPILAIAATALTEVPKNAMVVTKGSPEVSGIWVPLAAAQAYVQEHLAGAGKFADGEMEALDVFLSDKLVELFPPALQDFHRTTPARGLLNQFGRHFASTLQAARWEAVMEGSGSAGSAASSSPSASTTASSALAATPSPPPASLGASGAPLVPLPQQHAVSATPTFVVPLGLGLGERHEEKDMPLSATEQQLFHELCVLSDWERDPEGDEMMVVDVDVPLPPPALGEAPPPLSPMSALSDSPLSSPMSSPTITSFKRPAVLPPPTPAHARTESTETQKPLRRSKRVADALSQPPARAPSTRTRSRKGGAARNSLS
ncbi:hypothetical protein HYPSUDRAFT_198509 [Hypholoma sublateritium FD-334 SS-4]|uniref:GDS1 winged helix domain-containing protein n=1 Tax=Hypholoma sublateritium (strain FD-334 SS-4) TaxID=945553 RepID=A0A0D2PFE2_HYPSF|nr:hypothetical protein HYPSUDRAFT_198509 [Hypholoma sublateritium FD-334 SS-4]